MTPMDAMEAMRAAENERLGAEVERLRADNERLRAELAVIDARVKGARGIHRRNWLAEVEVERLRAEVQTLKAER